MTALARKFNASSDAFEEDFAHHVAEFPGASLGWLNARRRSAMTAFAATGIPNRRVEAWKYTDLASALDTSLPPVMPGQVPMPAERIFPPQPVELIFTDGFLTTTAEDDRLEICDLSALGHQAPDWVRDNLGLLASGPDQPLGAASLALMRGGAAIRVRKNVSLMLHFANSERPDAAVSHTRILLVVETGVGAQLLEAHTGIKAGRSLRNIGFETVLRPHATLEHIRMQKDAVDAIHVAAIGLSLDTASRYRALYCALGAELSRVDVNIRLSPHSEAVINSVAALASGTADTTTVMDHATPHTRSRQLFKSVLGGTGRVVNQGRVIVRQGAVKSDSHQLFKALLLSPRAEADAKPELEILADDVACGHGTAIGSLDDNALFYLRSRGIPEHEAKLLLIRAFLADAIEDFADEEIRGAVWRELESGLAAAGAGLP